MYRNRSVVVIAVLLLLVAGCAQQAAAPPAIPAATTVVAPPSTQTAPSPAPTIAPPTTALLATPSRTLAPTARPSATQAAPISTAAAPATLGSADPPVIVAMKDYAFVPKDVTVAPGTTVTWRNDDSAPHTATADDKLFNSGDMSQGARFSYTFTKPGVYPYYCTWHGSSGGQGMAGTVTVK